MGPWLDWTSGSLPPQEATCSLQYFNLKGQLSFLNPNCCLSTALSKRDDIFRVAPCTMIKLHIFRLRPRKERKLRNYLGRRMISRRAWKGHQHSGKFQGQLFTLRFTITIIMKINLLFFIGGILIFQSR